MLDSYLKSALSHINDAPNSVKAAWKYFSDAPRTVHCLVGAASLYAFYRLVIKKKYHMPPSPRGLPLLGNLNAFRHGTLGEVINEWAKKYGSIFTMHLGPVPVIVINDVDLMLEALVQKGSDFSGRPFVFSLDKFAEGSKSVASATYGDSWKNQKKVLVQCLRQYLTGRQLEERVHEVMQLVLKNIELEEGPFVLQPHLSLCVINVLHGLCFETTLNMDDPNFKYLTKIFDDFNDETGNGFFEDFIPLLHYWPTKRFNNIYQQFMWIISYIKDYMEERTSKLNEDDQRCLCDTIILSQKEVEADNSSQLTDVHVRQIIVDVFGAGVDTTRSTLEWIFLVLIGYPDIQARMQKEIDDVVGEKIPGKEHRIKLIYTEAVILETMRLYAVAPLSVPHSNIRDSSVGGYEIPSDTTIMINQHLILRDPKHWEDPLKFKPERFMSEDGSKLINRNRSFIPFSVGHRACPGETLAKLDLVYIVVGLLQKYTFSLPPGEKADFTPNTNFVSFRAPVYNVVAKTR